QGCSIISCQIAGGDIVGLNDRHIVRTFYPGVGQDDRDTSRGRLVYDRSKAFTVNRGKNDRVDLSRNQRFNRRHLFFYRFMAGDAVDFYFCPERFAFCHCRIGHIFHEDVADDCLWQNSDDRLGGTDGYYGESRRYHESERQHGVVVADEYRYEPCRPCHFSLRRPGGYFFLLVLGGFVQRVAGLVLSANASYPRMVSNYFRNDMYSKLRSQHNSGRPAHTGVRESCRAGNLLLLSAASRRRITLRHPAAAKTTCRY